MEKYAVGDDFPVPHTYSPIAFIRFFAQKRKKYLPARSPFGQPPDARAPKGKTHRRPLQKDFLQ